LDKEEMRIALRLLVSLALAGAPAVRAAEPDNAKLQQEVKALREVVLDLQERVNQLEGRQPPAASRLGSNSSYVSPEAALRANWSKVEQAMDQGEVTRLLGAPSNKFTLDGRTVWYYYYPATGSGSVFFTDAGRVSSRQSPFGWGW
jgi:hypothetical protein